MTDPPITARRTYRLRAVLLAAAASAALAGAGGYFAAHRRAGDAGAAAAHARYQCPMHPGVVQDHPGDCPICGMKLVEVHEEKGDSAKAAPPEQRKIKFYRSPMDPTQTSPVPRKDEMGMDFVPVYADEEGRGPSSSVDGMATVDIDPARQQLIGLRTAAVTRGSVGGAWRTVATVAVDQTRVRRINIKVPAYVERIYVDYVGKPVRSGEALFTAYSPDLLAAQEDYLIAMRTRTSLSSSAEVPVDASGLVEAARKKLELLDVPASAIRRLETTGKATRTLTFRSPIAGVVTRKDVVEGMKLDAGAMPYEITDLASVWVLADVYESDIRHVKLGMRAKLTLNAFPNRIFEGTATFIDPVVDPVTRTLKVRFDFPNKHGELRPGMFGEVLLEGATRESLRVPEDAVIDSGTRKVVFVALGDGKFQPREVQLGESDGPDVAVVSGLTDGERVVVRANFLVDSESRLRFSLSGLGDARAAPAAPSGSASPAVSSAPHGGSAP